MASVVLLETPPAPALDESPLEALPLDCQRKLIELLDGRSLALYAECTSRKLALSLADSLRPLWVAHAVDAAARTPSPAEPPAEPPAFGSEPRWAAPPALPPTLPEALSDSRDARECKSAYLRSMSAVERRCPRCGRQSRGRDTSLDERGRWQRHLCDYFVAKPRGPVPIS
jgi:hypothetical protein